MGFNDTFFFFIPAELEIGGIRNICFLVELCIFPKKDGVSLKSADFKQLS